MLGALNGCRLGIGLGSPLILKQRPFAPHHDVALLDCASQPNREFRVDSNLFDAGSAEPGNDHGPEGRQLTVARQARPEVSIIEAGDVFDPRLLLGAAIFEAADVEGGIAVDLDVHHRVWRQEPGAPEDVGVVIGLAEENDGFRQHCSSVLTAIGGRQGT